MRFSVECAFPYLRKRGAISRRSAFWVGGLTEKRILGGWGHGKAHSTCGQSRRVRLSVTSQPQNASFRKVRFSLPAQTWSHLTEKRILRRRPHGKAHSGWGASRKSALCDSQIAQSALFRHIAAQEVWGATTRQAAGRFAPGSANLVWSLTSRKVAVWVRSLGAQLGRAAWMSSLGAQSG